MPICFELDLGGNSLAVFQKSLLLVVAAAADPAAVVYRQQH
jgi:hypothetical protein